MSNTNPPPSTDPEKTPHLQVAPIPPATPTSSNGADASKHVSTAPSSLTPPVTALSPPDLAHLCKAIGAPPRDPETQNGSPPLNWYWPPRNLPRGLYRDVITSRTKSQYSYYFTATLYNLCLVLQLLLGASLTALGSTSSKNHIAVTILAAANTVNAGLVALLHNSGLPNRIMNDWNEYDKVEMFLEELIDSGVVEVGMTWEDVVASCWKKYMAARATVNANKPSVYTGASPGNLGVPSATSSVPAAVSK